MILNEIILMDIQYTFNVNRYINLRVPIVFEQF